MWTAASAADSVIVTMKSVAHETEQDQHRQLRPPPRHHIAEHRDRAFAVRALLRHPAIHRQRAEQREEDEDQGRDRRQELRGEKGDAGLVRHSVEK